MFKLFKKQKKDKLQANKEKKDDCPMCSVPPEVVEQLKRDDNQEKSKKSCCD